NRPKIRLLYEKSGSVPALVPELPCKVAMKRVGAGLRHDGNRCAARMPHTRVKILRFYLVFLDGRRIRQIGGGVSITDIRNSIYGPVIPAHITDVMRLRCSPQRI